MLGNNQLKRLAADEHNSAYEREKAVAVEKPNPYYRRPIKDVRELASCVKGEVCITDGAVTISNKVDDRGPIFISGGEYGRMVAREHIARIEAGEYDLPGMVKPFINNRRYYQRGNW